MNIYDALNEYKQYLLIEKKVSDNTLKNYMRDLEHFINYIQKQNQVVLINQIDKDTEKSGYPLPLHAVLSFPEKKLLSVPSASSGIHYSQSFHFSVSSIVRQNMPVLIFQDLSDPEPPLFRAPNAWQESEYRHPHCA